MKYFFSLLVLFSSLASADDGPCKQKAPADFKQIKSEKHTQVFQSGSLVMTMKCQPSTPEELTKVMGELKDQKKLVSLGGQAYFYEMNLAGAVSRSYLVPQTDHLLYVSFISSKNDFANLDFSQKIVGQIIGQD